MKTHLKTTALLGTALFFSLLLSAQPPAPKDGPGKLPPPPPKEKGLQEITAVNGKVVKLAANDDYVYDGFYLLSGSDSLLVKFPPHMGAQVTKAAAVGSTVTVNGVRHTSPEGRKELRMVSLTVGGQTINEAPPAAPQTPPAANTVSGTGKITAVQTGRQGEVKGIVLDGNTIVKMPPHVASQLGSGLQTGGTVAYTGTKKPANSGEAMSQNVAIVHSATITVNGKQYLVK